MGLNFEFEISLRAAVLVLILYLDSYSSAVINFFTGFTPFCKVIKKFSPYLQSSDYFEKKMKIF